MFNRHLKATLAEREADLARAVQLLSLMDQAGIVLRLDADNRVTECNAAFTRALGYADAQVLGQKLSQLVPGYVSKLPCFHAYAKAVAAGVPVRDDYRFLRANGSLAWLRLTWHPVRDAQGALQQIVGYGCDVSAEVSLARENQALLDALLRSTATIQFNLNGTVLGANEQFLASMGYSLNQVVGEHHRMFCEPEYAASPAYAEFWRTLNAGQYVNGRFKRLDSRGREVWLEASYNPVNDAEGNLVRVVKFASVVTDQVQRENEVRRAAQMALEVSNSTDVSASEGASVVDQAVSTMQSVSQQMQSAAVTIEALGKQSVVISSIVQTIETRLDMKHMMMLKARLRDATVFGAHRRHGLLLDCVERIQGRKVFTTRSEDGFDFQGHHLYWGGSRTEGPLLALALYSPTTAGSQFYELIHIASVPVLSRAHLFPVYRDEEREPLKALVSLIDWMAGKGVKVQMRRPVIGGQVMDELVLTSDQDRVLSVSLLEQPIGPEPEVDTFKRYADFKSLETFRKYVAGFFMRER